MLRLATRSSPLARWQAEHVASQLAAAGRHAELVFVSTAGDRRGEEPIRTFSGQGVFVAEVEQAVLDGRADAAVHSAKDLPAGAPPAGLVLAAVPPRADVRDVLVGRSLAELAPGATVASGAARRRSQLGAVRPDLRFVELRGNIATRLERVPDGGAVVVALAALTRLGLLARAAEVLDTATMLPQVGQGAIAVRCREDDEEARLLLAAAADDAVAHTCLDAERSFLARLGGGCDAPVGAWARPVPAAEPGVTALLLEGLLASGDGSTVVRREGAGTEPVVLGTTVADAVGAAARLAGLEGAPAAP